VSQQPAAGTGARSARVQAGELQPRVAEAAVCGGLERLVEWV